MEFRIKLFAFCAVLLAVKADISNQEYDGGLKEATNKFSQLLHNALKEPSRFNEGTLPSTVFETNLRTINFKDGGRDLYFKNAAIDRMSPVIVDSVTPHLEQASIRVKAHWGVLAFSGTYGESNGDKLLQLEINLENIKAEGLAGYSLVNDVPSVINTQLSFSIGDLFIKNVQTGQTAEVDDSLHKIITSYFEKDISEVLKQNLKEYLNERLSAVVLEKVFDDDTQRIAKYRSDISQIAKNADQLADFILEVLERVLEQTGYNNIPVPELHERFSTKWGFINMNVEFDATNGNARDPTTIHRTGTFSVDGDFQTDDFTLYGSVGLKTLAVNFGSYRAKAGIFSASGDADITVDHNSVSFSISGKVEEKVIKIKKDFSFKISALDGINVKATGWSVVLNWLLNIIATKAVNSMQGEISSQIESGVHSAIQEQLEKLNYEIPIGLPS